MILPSNPYACIGMIYVPPSLGFWGSGKARNLQLWKTLLLKALECCAQTDDIEDLHWDFLRNGMWLSLVLSLLQTGIGEYCLKNKCPGMGPISPEYASIDNEYLTLAKGLISSLLEAGFSPLLLLKHTSVDEGMQDGLLDKSGVTLSSGDFIDGTSICPEKDLSPGVINPAFVAWRRQNRTILIGSTPRIMQLRLRITITKKGSMSMIDYIMKIKGAADNLATIGEPVSEQDQVMNLLGEVVEGSLMEVVDKAMLQITIITPTEVVDVEVEMDKVEGKIPVQVRNLNVSGQTTTSHSLNNWNQKNIPDMVASASNSPVDESWIRHTKMVLAQGKLENGLYKFPVFSNKKPYSSTLGFIHYKQMIRPFPSLSDSSFKWRISLTPKLSAYSLIMVENFDLLCLFFKQLVLPIDSHVDTTKLKMAELSGSTYTIYITPHVVFDESTFPLAQSKSSISSNDTSAESSTPAIIAPTSFLLHVFSQIQKSVHASIDSHSLSTSESPVPTASSSPLDTSSSSPATDLPPKSVPEPQVTALTPQMTTRSMRAMEMEIAALHRNHTWDLVEQPPDVNVIGCKWMYKLKHKPDGSIERYKPGLWQKGYNQTHGLDYFETFRPVVKAAILTVALSFKWEIRQLNVHNAFLNAKTPGVVGKNLSKFDGDPMADVTHYRSVVGALQNNARWLLLSPSSNLTIEGFTDADWGAHLDDRRRSSGYLVYLGGNLVSWSSTKQKVVSHSSAESEYRGLVFATG
ncbi:Retrovirus-related Pol polyprotein from transposon RE2 [Vitis vinifera]|uniref:Retrovirus-related Pol polyprotein from transposon RE2 n=1 Tax=Vitis vinifera TaxID=29760 RepID=A0A438JFS7_VITVI|nr:Retrovirus-related Pol polyprotein from transposon RE2 [Vitis vinifera]